MCRLKTTRCRNTAGFKCCPTYWLPGRARLFARRWPSHLRCRKRLRFQVSHSAPLVTAKRIHAWLYGSLLPRERESPLLRVTFTEIFAYLVLRSWRQQNVPCYVAKYILLFDHTKIVVICTNMYVLLSRQRATESRALKVFPYIGRDDMTKYTRKEI